MRLTIGARLKVEGIPARLAEIAVRGVSAPNPEFVNRQRLGKWLGDIPPTITLAEWDGDALLLPRWHVETFITRAKAAGVQFTLTDERLRLPVIDIQLRGELRSYQAAALEAVTKHGSGVVVAPCGSGKTCLGMALIAHWKQPAVVIVHTRELLKQTCDAVREWLGVEPGTIGDGVWNPQPVTVALVQSLARNPERTAAISKLFGLVLVDECHHSPAATFTQVIQGFPAAFRYGLSATPQRRDGLSSFMLAVIGPVRHEIVHDDLKAAGKLVSPRVEWVQMDFTCGRDLEWTALIATLTQDHVRNGQIVRLALGLIDEGCQTILLSERVAHAERLAEIVEDLRPGQTALIVGSMKKSERESAMERIRSGEARLLVATKLADEGLDAPSLNALVLTTPSRDAARTMQRVGRILRSVPGKPQPVVYDLVDSRVGMLASQARTRYFECYRKLASDCRLPEWLERQRRAA